MRHIITLILAALALCGTAQATTYTCMGSTLAGETTNHVGRQFGTRAGDWENPLYYQAKDPATGKSVGWSFYWYCAKTIQVPVPTPVPSPGAIGSTPIPTTLQRVVYVENWGGTYDFFAGLPSNWVAQFRAQGPNWLALTQRKQCWEQEAYNAYLTPEDKILCTGLLSKARAYAPQ
jgi:hypothetical protein